ncbi:MAG: HepT-like ribonuclease domain-containing protein [Bryobacteraceae bacterium]
MPFVPSKDPLQRLEDILANIIMIEEFTAGMSSVEFAADPKTTNAVERCLERISEAATKLSGQAELICPEIPWPQVRALGNMLRHEYDRIEVVRIWFLIEDDLPPLKAAVERALKSGEIGRQFPQ